MGLPAWDSPTPTTLSRLAPGASVATARPQPIDYHSRHRTEGTQNQEFEEAHEEIHIPSR
jgi:hypothetical protein